MQEKLRAKRSWIERSLAGRHGCRLLFFHFLDHRVGELRGSGLAANVAGQLLAMAVDFFEGIANLSGGLELAEMAQHEQRRSQQGGWIGEIFSRDIGSRAVDGLKNSAVVAEVGTGNESQAADEGGAQIGKNVAVKIFHDQHVVLVRVHYQLHAGVVYDVLAVGDLGKAFGDIAAAAKK